MCSRHRIFRRHAAAAILMASAVIGAAGSTDAAAQEPTFYAGPVAPLTAAVWKDHVDEIRRLLAEGADPNLPSGKPALTPWQVAVIAGSQQSLDLFSTYAAARPASHYTPTLFKIALQRGDARLVSTFIRGGASLRFTDVEYTPLGVAGASGYDDVMQVLLGAGANINEQDGFGDTALMAAVRAGRLEAVRLLLDRGADVQLADRQGRTAMTWAHQTARADVIAALRAHGAVVPPASGAEPRPPVPLRTAIERGLVLLQQGGASWNERTKCGSCHHQGLLVPVASAARRHGFTIREEHAAAQEERLSAMLAGLEPGIRAAVDGDEGLVRLSLGFVGQAGSGTALLMAALASAGTAKPTHDVVAVTLGRLQMLDGRWRVGALRVPTQESDIQTTSLAIRVLLAFAPTHADTATRVERARAWLLSSVPATTQDRAYRLLGLRWAGADHSDVKEATRTLLKEQGEDGGWAQLTGLNADAYATGLALVALQEGGDLSVTHASYQRGVAYLIRTQQDDGSWFVHKRAASMNAYFETGFPHGKHQFSSFVGTAWATMALMHAAGSSSP
jgi:hypothetical protein